MTLANQYREFVTPLLVKAFANVNGTNPLRVADFLLRKVEERPPASLQDIVQKEAVYCAVGRCAHRLRDDLNLSSWMETAKDEAKNPSAEYVRNDVAPRIC
jgi:hypothetical protein